MKKLNILFITTIVVLLSISCATINPSEVKGMTKIVEAPGASKDELFVKASSWLVDAFNSAKSVIQFSDKEKIKRDRPDFDKNRGRYNDHARRQQEAASRVDTSIFRDFFDD